MDLFLGPQITTFAIGPVQGNAHYSVLANLAHTYPDLMGVYIAHLDPDLNTEDEIDEDEIDEEAFNEEGDGNQAKEVPMPTPTDDDLSRFPKLAIVSIMIFSGYDLDDEVVSDLARAWPHLQELRLQTSGYNHRPRNTLLSLQVLAQHCPRLHALEMTFDATTVPPRASTSQARILHDSLVVLVPSYSHISDAFPVARFLSGIFTNLTEVKQVWGENRQLWDEVSVFVAELHEIRKEEVCSNGRKVIAECYPHAANICNFLG
ncbi:hypothetical protein K438DRAFT_2029900 [Mycena galopus ATCC 62051]|nr:hypothetical protein K438DRAFT_2029900 [Mycena galopus ATCC 62051]